MCFERFETVGDLLVGVATFMRIFIKRHEHAYDAPAFFTIPAGIDPAVFFMGCMTGGLVLLQMWIAFDKCFQDLELAETAEHGVLKNVPAFLGIISCEDDIEILALIE